ncbi:hypothetical protein JTE90_004611 [Oedothorax gibbosus]|uniref:FAD dependent oxidoreductase domain-containing protein n=1 Tax=Oedothorax gibbosus TaxID=931172 RepID=A0AAV6UR92_9ARAC|nr:hypothetical protein JTE90_004611 [Oedothorax gibbosus]
MSIWDKDGLHTWFFKENRKVDMVKKKVCVLGAGVIGLTTAVKVATLEKEAVEVTLMSEHFSPHTTGDGSAGLIEPYFLGDTSESTIRTWVSRSVGEFEKLRRSPEASQWGVDLITFFELLEEPQSIPFYADVVVDCRQMIPKELALFPDKYKFGHRVTTYIVECKKYLPMMLKRLQSMGGKVIQKRVESMDELAGDFDVVINCCGIGAASLVRDPLLKPVRGQVTYVKAPWIQYGVITGNYYVIPNSDYVVCGGTAQIGDWNQKIDKSDREEIWKMCTELVPSLERAEVLQEWAGLRPYRSRPRIERDTLRTSSGDLEVIHNYGHGGCGVTVSWGCAQDAHALLRPLLKIKSHI